MGRCTNSGWSGQRRERVSRKKIKVCEDVEKSRKTKDCVCRMSCGSGGSKSRFAKAAGAERMRGQKLHRPLSRQAHFDVTMLTALHVRSTFGG